MFAADELGEFVTRELRLRAILAGVPEETPPEHQSDRIQELERQTAGATKYLYLAPILLRHWRNRIIHHDSRARLSAAEKNLLLDHAAELSGAHKGIDLGRLLTDWEHDRPSLKDVTVLLAMSTRWARAVDARLPVIATAEDVSAWLAAEGLLEEIMHLESLSRNVPNADVRARGRQLLITRAAVLAEPNYQLGAT